MERPSTKERYGALMVDFVSIVMITVLLMNSASYPVKFIAVSIPLVYFPVFHTLLSRTIGDMVFRLRVVDRQGNKIGFRLARNRFLCVFMHYIFAAVLTNLLLVSLVILSGDLKDIRDVSFDYEGESKTYLVKAG